MIEFINKFTGTQMWVAESRADEYKKAGHKPALSAVKPDVSEPEEAPKKGRRSTK